MWSADKTSKPPRRCGKAGRKGWQITQIMLHVVPVMGGRVAGRAGREVVGAQEAAIKYLRFSAGGRGGKGDWRGD